MSAPASQRGVTLLELIIAITLVGLLVAGATTAMQAGLGTMERSNRGLMRNRRIMGVDRIMHMQIAELMPVKADCRTDPAAPGTLVPFFEGEPLTMRFVSAYSLEEGARGYPRILEYQVIPRDDGDGVRLIVNEWLYSGPLSAGAACAGVVGLANGPIGRYRPPVIGERSFVLADNLARCAFTSKEEFDQPPFERWTPQWRSVRFPRAIRIELVPLDESPRVKLMPLTVSLRITRDPMVRYDEQ
jgi:prepilin-type N-terminal cleavage/methylation domain-containing protein